MSGTPETRQQRLKNLAPYKWTKGNSPVVPLEARQRAAKKRMEKLYDGKTLYEKMFEGRIKSKARKELLKQEEFRRKFEKKYGVLFKDNRTGAWEEEQQEDSLQQEDE